MYRDWLIGRVETSAGTSVLYPLLYESSKMLQHDWVRKVV